MRILIHGDQRLYPVIEALSLERGCDLVLVGNAVRDQLQSQGIQYLELEDCVNDTVKARVAEAMPRYLDLIMNQWAKLAAHPQAAYEQKQILPAIESELEQTARTSLIEELLFIEAFLACHAEQRIDAVCLLDDFPRPFLTITRAAQQQNVPVVHVAHGIYFHDEGRKLAADTIAVSGWYNMVNLPTLGFDPRRITVTGNPAWDYYSRLPAVLPPRREIKEQLGLKADSPLIVYYSTWSENREWLRKLQEGFAALLVGLRAVGREDCHIVVKTHPFGDGDTSVYQQLAAAAGFTNLTFSDQYKELLLWGADTVILETASSLMIEGALLGRPVIVLMRSQEKQHLFAGIGWPHDAILTCEPDPLKLACMLKELLPQGDLPSSIKALLPATIEKFNLANDGNAARRVSDLVTSMSQSLARATG